jgi:hypothetical protein
MGKVISTPLMVLSAWGLVVAATGAVGCGGASGGTRGVGGSTGSGGAPGTGTGGMTVAGMGGSGVGGMVVPLNCPGGVDPAAGLLTDFSPATWMNTQGRWSTVAGDLTGSKYAAPSGVPNPDGGAASTMSGTVTFMAANPSFELTGMIRAGDYGFGLLSFDKCVNTATYAGVRFTLGGTTGGCDLLLLLQTFDQQSVGNKGGCTTGCYHFPQTKIQVGSAPVTVLFTDLANTGMPAAAADMKTQIVGLQWQLQSPGPSTDGGAQPACAGIDLTIDDVQFVTGAN